MFRMKKFLFGGLALLLLVGFLLGCGSAPTPSTPPMVRVQIELNDVVCNGKQAVWVWQQDIFYMMTTFSASGPTASSAAITQSHISDPITMDNHQKDAIPPGPLVVFDAVLPQSGIIRGGFTAYNGGIANYSFAQLIGLGNSVAETVGDKLLKQAIDSENLAAIAGAAILDLAIHAFATLFDTSNNPTLLGKQDENISANGSSVDHESLSFVQNDGPGNTWNYQIDYTILRTIMSGTA